jgi:hypothetical protein
MKNHPNLFLIGAPKCGTTSLTAEITQHPQIFGAAVKEPRFYDAEIFYDLKEDQQPISQAEYLGLYADAPETSDWRLDSSVFIMYNLPGIDAILAASPNAKFILMVRDPLEASKSMHIQRLKTFYTHLREVDEDFYKCFDMVKDRAAGDGFPPGCKNRILFQYDRLYSYEKYVPDLQSKLGEKLLILNYENYRADPSQTHKQIFDFLEVDPKFACLREERNLSEVASPSAAARFAYGVANRLITFRKIAAPLYRMLAPLKRIVLPRQKATKQKDPARDILVKGGFAQTYVFLENFNGG